MRVYEQIDKLHYCKNCGMVCHDTDDYCKTCIIDEIYDATHIEEEYELEITKYKLVKKERGKENE
jgi:hypothetical protein